MQANVDLHAATHRKPKREHKQKNKRVRVKEWQWHEECVQGNRYVNEYICIYLYIYKFATYTLHTYIDLRLVNYGYRDIICTY